MPLNSGSKLGPYEIVAPIGAGGMGEVYRALDTRLDRSVAIKILPETWAADPERRLRFEREARAVAALSHPHICALYDVGEQNGLHYTVMEFVEGETLAARLERGALPLDLALRHGAEIAEALDQAHRHGIIHRDLKPGNVMLTRSGAKLLDFGLAKPALTFATASSATGGIPPTGLPTQTNALTAEGSILGTVEYMAPEQFEGREADARTDIFSLGTVLYEMIAGRRPFTGPSQASIIGATLHSEPEPLSSSLPAVPQNVDRLVRRCLAKNPEDRWQSARDLAIELQWISGQPAVSPQPSMTAATKFGRIREWIAWIAAASFLLLTLVLAVTSGQREPETRIPAFELSVVEPEDAPFTSIGDGGAVALSPDGLRLAFVCSNAEGKRFLYVRPLDSAQAQMQPGTEGATQPFWSPDGKRVGFFAGGKLKRIDLEGGALQILADAPNPRGATWSTKETILFAPHQRDGLYRVVALGGRPERVTTLDEKKNEGSHRCPFFLPDGESFLYLVTGPRGETQRVMLGKIGSGPELGLPLDVLRTNTGVKWVPGRDGRFGFLLFLRDSSLMAWKFDPVKRQTLGDPVPIADPVGANIGLNRADFSVSSAGILAYRASMSPTTRLVWFDNLGKELGTLGDPNLYRQPRLSPDGKRVAVERADPQTGNTDVWTLDPQRGVASRVTHDAAYDGFPVWSPDGEKILFMSERQGSGKLYVKASSGAGQEQEIPVAADFLIPTDWSRDGRFILFTSVNLRTVKSDLWVMPLVGNRKPIPCLQTEFDETQGQFSPSGKWISYASDESGRPEVYVQSFPDPESSAIAFKLQISKNGGSQPRWSADGKEISYIAPGGDLMVVRIDDSKKQLNASFPQVLFKTRIPSTGARIEYTVAATGKLFLINTVVGGRESPPVSIMLDWRSRLENR